MKRYLYFGLSVVVIMFSIFVLLYSIEIYQDVADINSYVPPDREVSLLERLIP